MIAKKWIFSLVLVSLCASKFHCVALRIFSKSTINGMQNVTCFRRSSKYSYCDMRATIPYSSKSVVKEVQSVTKTRQNRCIRDLLDMDIDRVLKIAFDEYMPESLQPQNDRILSFLDQADRLMLRLTIMFGFKLRIHESKTGRHRKVFCVSNAETDICLGLAEISIQPVDGKVPSAFPLPYAFKRLIFGVTHQFMPYISNVLVDYEHRKKGLGSALIEECELQAEKWGYPYVYLHADLHYAPALRLYENRGYEIVKDDPDWFSNFNMTRLRYMRKKVANLNILESNSPKQYERVEATQISLKT